MFYRFRISEWRIDVSLAQENITARNSPQHSLKANDTFTVNNASNEPQLLWTLGQRIALRSLQVCCGSAVGEKILGKRDKLINFIHPIIITTHLCSFQHVTKLGKLLEVLQQLREIFRKLQDFVFRLLELSFKVDKLSRIRNSR